jgi:predicted NAD/FAD-binding protein
MPKRSIAIVGSGVSGLSAAWFLNKQFKVFLIEKEPRLGGHTHTHDISENNNKIFVDSGFIVFNDVNYPNFTKWLDELGVNRSKAEMSFSVSKNSGSFEWGGKNFSAIFGQKKNLFSAKFLTMLFEINRFNSISLNALKHLNLIKDMSLKTFLSENAFSTFFSENYIIPMAGSIWSTPSNKIADYPAASLIKFLSNHGLLSAQNHHQWYSILDGSKTYIDKFEQSNMYKSKSITQLLEHKVDRVELNGKESSSGKINITGKNLKKQEGFSLKVDEIVFACHSDQTSRIIKTRREESEILSNITYQRNKGYLHEDISLMPKRKRVWSAWNYLSSQQQGQADQISITYWMNRLQKLRTNRNVFVSLNPPREPKKSQITKELVYEHPVFDAKMIKAREKVNNFQGDKGFWYCGAWTGHGFHEDGFVSGKKIATEINKRYKKNLYVNQ